MTTPTWLPDWRDPAQYPDKNASPTHLAWQFLRRNPDYQAAYAKVVKPLRERYGSNWREYSPPLSMNDHIALAQLAEKFDLAAPVFPSPDINDPQPLIFKGLHGVSFPNPKHYRQEPGKVLIELDLSLPLDVQVHRLKQFWPTLQSQNQHVAHSARHHWDKLALYLRVLDAYACGATRAEIASVLVPHKSNSQSDEFSGSKTIDKWRKAAIDYRDKKYKLLPIADTEAASFS